MLTMREYIKRCLKQEGRTMKWLADSLEMNYKTFSGKLNNETLSAVDLFKICAKLSINLESMRKELPYDFVYGESHVYLLDDERIYEKEVSVGDIQGAIGVPVIKARITRGTLVESSVGAPNGHHVFVPEVNDIGGVVYRLKAYEQADFDLTEETYLMIKDKKSTEHFVLGEIGDSRVLRRAPSNIANAQPHKISLRSGKR